MREFENKRLEYHRRGFYFEIKKDTVINYMWLSAAVGVGFILIKFALKKEEEYGIALERIKIRRMNENI